MKKIFIFLVFISFTLSCNLKTEEADQTINPENPTVSIPKTTAEINKGTEPEEPTKEEGKETENPRLIEKEDLSELPYLTTFLPKDHLVLDYHYGDLNKDELKKDVILIAHNPKAEAENEDEVKRPLFILTRTTDGKLKKESRNDNVVLCSSCGGVMGDPYQDIAIKNGYFSIEHYGGSSWRWTEIVTFKYNAEKTDWFLHKKGGEEFHSSKPDESKETVKTVKDFGLVSFETYE